MSVLVVVKTTVIVIKPSLMPIMIEPIILINDLRECWLLLSKVLAIHMSLYTRKLIISPILIIYERVYYLLSHMSRSINHP